MSIPNPPLEAALIQFTGHPGVTPNHALQLRNALTQDATLLAHYNQLAADGELGGFALPQSGDPNVIGAYQKASGTIALPIIALQPSGSSPSPNLTSTLRIQEMSARYAHGTWTDASGTQHPVSQDMVDNFQTIVNGSPALAEQLRQATMPPASGQEAPVRSFDSLPNGANAGGTYDPTSGTINMPPGVLNQPPAQFQQNAHAVTDLTFVLGHEVQHGLNAANKAAARTAFLGRVAQIAQHGGPSYDYTVAIDGYQQAARHDEARAHIAGWNALLSREKQANPSANLTEMLDLASRQNNPGTSRINDFVLPDLANPGQALARPGFSFDSDGHLSTTPANVEQMARNYFDKSPSATRIGHHGDSDYPNYYGANAVTSVIFNHKHYAGQPNGTVPPFQVDMAHLRLDEQLLERNGIAFPPGTPLPTGASTDVRQSYVDTGQTPHAPGHFDYTRTPSGTANSHQHVPIPPAGPASEPRLSSDFSQYLDRMLAAAESRDQATFREMTRMLAEQPAGQSLRAEASDAVDQLQEQGRRNVEQQDVQRQQQAPALQMQH